MFVCMHVLMVFFVRVGSDFGEITGKGIDLTMDRWFLNVGAATYRWNGRDGQIAATNSLSRIC